MIFNIKESNKGEVVFVEVIPGTAWEAAWMMDYNVYLGCFNGYENCLVFHKD